MKHARLLTLLLVLPLLVGCFHARSLNETRLDIERNWPGADFESEFQFTVGRLGMAIVRSLADDESRDLMKSVRKVEIGVYFAESLPEGSYAPATLPKLFALDDWKTLTSVRSEDSLALVLARFRDENVRDMMVVVLEDEEMVLIRLRGDLQKMLDHVLEKKTLDVPGLVTADLEPEPDQPMTVLASETGATTPRQSTKAKVAAENSDQSFARTSLPDDGR